MRSPCNKRGGGELGAAAAELAVALPAVILLLAFALLCIMGAGEQVALQDAAGDAARAAARGDDPAQFARGASITVSTTGDLVCVTLGTQVVWQLVPLEASSCADAAGR